MSNALFWICSIYLVWVVGLILLGSYSCIFYLVRPGCQSSEAYSSTDLIIEVYISTISLDGVPALFSNVKK